MQSPRTNIRREKVSGDIYDRWNCKRTDGLAKKISENSSIHDDNLNYIEPVMVRIDSIFDYLSENVQMQL